MRILSLILIMLSCAAYAKIELPQIFSDNMVLQAGMPLNFWGKSAPNAKVEISIGKNRYAYKANSEGLWRLKVAPLAVDATAQNIEFFENAELSKTIKNVLVGEVWIAGGQSNMAFKLARDENAKEAIEGAELPQVRFFRQDDNATALQPRFESPRNSGWSSCKKSNARNFSAVGFYFAKGLAENLKTPIGIIETPRSGSYMVCWLAKEDLKGIECFEKSYAKFEAENKNYNYENEREKYKEKLAEYNELVKAAKAEGADVKKIKKPNAPAIARGNSMAFPCLYYNAKISPIAPFSARGVLWYQGESDAIVNSQAFAEKFERLIFAWRKYWQNPEMAFCYVQLPSIGRDFWVPVRTAQSEVLRRGKNLAMAVAIDLGEEKDVHPKNKSILSKRLVNQALLKFYGFKKIADFPAIKSSVFRKNSAVITLNMPIKLEGEARGFEVLVGEQWVQPTVKISKNKILLESENGEILGARYLAKGWAKPDVCIFGADDLPLSPFEILKK